MVAINRKTTTPRRVSRSKRNHVIEHLSSLKPGVVHPVFFAPVLREDRLRGRVQFAIEMMEAKELIANQVKAHFRAVLIPWSAMARFQKSRDQFDRSWMGKPKTDDPGETVTAFFTTQLYPQVSDMPIFKAAGKHYSPVVPCNTMYVEAYNIDHNYRLRQKSKELGLRTPTDISLAPAFWDHNGFDYIVPDFDQAAIAGEIAIDVLDSHLAVKGLGISTGASTTAALTIKETGGTTQTGVVGWTQSSNIRMKEAGPGTGFPEIYALLTANNLTTSLAAMKRATKLKGFAEVRKHFEGHGDDDIIDMYMAGLTLPDQWLFDPIVLDEERVVFRQGKRYSSTANELDNSAVSGIATASLSLSAPQIAVGGVVLITCEILPDQLWERRADPFLYADSVSDLPDALLDSLDEEQVHIVTNRMIDIGHSLPNDTFGYEPMNARWTSWGPTIGGDFLKMAGSTGNTEARKRIWAQELVDPVLTDDFYIAKDGIHTKPFLDEVLDPFQIQASGNLVLEGLTQFGGVLIEATGNYDKLDALPGNDIIVKP